MCQRNHKPQLRQLLFGTVFGVLAALMLGRAQGSGVTPTNTWMDIYGGRSSFAGMLLPVGANIAVLDPQGTKCGERVVTTAGYISPVMPCYGDDTGTPADEGAIQGDLLSFSVNGSIATPQPRARNFQPIASDTPVRWYAQDRWEVDLYVPPRPPATIGRTSGQTQVAWQAAGVPVARYEVWHSTSPYFIAGDSGSALIKTVLPGETFAWFGSEGVGNPAVNYTYRVVCIGENAQMIGASQAVAEFDFALVH